MAPFGGKRTKEANKLQAPPIQNGVSLRGNYMEDSEITRLRAELRVNKKAYASLQKEKDDLSKVWYILFVKSTVNIESLSSTCTVQLIIHYVYDGLYLHNKQLVSWNDYGKLINNAKLPLNLLYYIFT